MEAGPSFNPSMLGSSFRSARVAQPIELDDLLAVVHPRSWGGTEYSIGAVLLDKKDPSIILARSREPLVRPEPAEREGYVPNVVYTCGAMRKVSVSSCHMRYPTPSLILPR